MSRWPFMIRLEGIASPESPRAVVRMLPEIVERLGIGVVADVNGVEAWALPGMTPEEVEKSYFHAIDRAAESARRDNQERP